MEYPFYMGPLGSMRRLPSTKAKDEIGYQVDRSGGIRTAVGGRGTQDTWGSKQVWNFEWREESPEVLDFITRMWRLATRRTLRLLDPMVTRNLLSTACASVGAEPHRNPLRAFDVQSRTVTWSPTLDTDLPEDLYLVEGGLQWATVAGLDDMLRGDVGVRVPLLDQPTTFSCWARGDVSCLAALVPFDGGGGEGTALYGPEIALNASDWTRLVVTRPAGPGAISAVPGLAVAAGPQGVVETVGWQVEHSLEPTPWMQGGGCPQIMLTENDNSIIRGNRRNLSIGCREV